MSSALQPDSRIHPHTTTSTSTSDAAADSPLPVTSTQRLYGDALVREPLIAPAKADATRTPISSLLRLVPYLRPYAFTFWSTLGLALVAVLMGIANPLVTRRVIDGPVVSGNVKWLLALGSVALALGVGDATLSFIRRWFLGPATLGMETGLRLDLYAKLQRLPMSFHSRWQSGQLLSRIMSDLSTIRRFTAFGFTFLVVNTIQIVVVTVLLIQMYWPLGVLVLISVIPVVWLCLANERTYTKLSRRIQDQTGDVASSVEESIQGLRVIKAFGRAGHVFNRFDQRATALRDTALARVANTSRFWTFLEIIPTVTMILVLATGAFAASQHRLTLGTLVAFITLMLSLIWPIAALGFLLSMTQDAMTAADRICEIFDTTETITSGEVVLESPRGALEFQNVAFQFHDASDPVLQNLNLQINPGETIALVGGTGSGKSTLTSLVPRLADVTEGRILLDGVDVRDLELDQLRSLVATAFEDPTLFSMSVRENLTLGRPEATEAEIDEAIEVAQAHFVRDLPWGLDTRIGEQGMSLSGGQRQRLALARAVLVKPKVLVLDDTLSALDIHTEALVEEALKRVLVGVTGIVVAHRASTVLLADRVAMLENGTITHVGRHSELLETVPEYRELLSADFDAEEVLDDLEPNRTAEVVTEGSLR